MRIENEHEVDTRTEHLKALGGYKSDDPHVLALAQVSDVRLLYTNDGDLQQDFGDKNLIDNPRGKVYSTRVNKKLHASSQAPAQPHGPLQGRPLTTNPPRDKLQLPQPILKLNHLVDDLVGDAAVVGVEGEDRLAGTRGREQAPAA